MEHGENSFVTDETITGFAIQKTKSNLKSDPHLWGWDMQKMPYKSDPGLLSYIGSAIAFGMTLMGCLAAYAYKVINGEKFSWRTLSLQLIVSIFAGFMMMLIAKNYAWPQEITGAICGMAGWSGSSLIKALEARFLNRASGGEEVKDD